jgi:hypothetical protein
MVLHQRSPLVVVGGRVGRHGELSPGNGQKVSVTGCVEREWVGFREGRKETVRGEGVTVHSKAGRWCHGVSGSMPCRCVCGVGLGEAQVHRNTAVRSAWTGRPNGHMSAWSGWLALTRSGDSVSGN